MMPAINGNNTVNHNNNGIYDLAPPLLNVSKDTSLENSSQLGEILRDTQNQNRVVDNVMQFFRYKETTSDKKQQLAPPHMNINSNNHHMDPYNDYAYTALTTNQNSANNSISHTMPTGNKTVTGFAALESPAMHTSTKFNSKATNNRKGYVMGSTAKKDNGF